MKTKEEYQSAICRIALNYGLSSLDEKTNEIMDKNFGEDISLLQELIDNLKENDELEWLLSTCLYGKWFDSWSDSDRLSIWVSETIDVRVVMTH